MSTVVDYYSEANRDGARYVGSSMQAQGSGQSFTGDGGVLDIARFYIKKEGSPTGSAVAKVYTHSGTFGTSSVPTGAALATSGNLDVSGLTTSYQLISLTFTGANKITLTNGTKYVVSIEYNGGGASDYIVVGNDNSSPSHGGNSSTLQSGSWVASSGTDFCFYVYRDDSAGPSPSASVSASPSPSSSVSHSPSVSTSASPSPSPMPPAFFGLKIAKPGINVLTNSDIQNLIFSSDYGTLKYFTKQTINISFNAGAPDSNISATGSYNHDLDYYPYCEVFVRVYTGATPTGNYEYCPFYGAGATIFYSANYLITKTQIKVYGEINGVSTSTWHFDFLVFIFKNNLNL